MYPFYTRPVRIMPCSASCMRAPEALPPLDGLIASGECECRDVDEILGGNEAGLYVLTCILACTVDVAPFGRILHQHENRKVKYLAVRSRAGMFPSDAGLNLLKEEDFIV